jgi:hypothetical protein
MIEGDKIGFLFEGAVKTVSSYSPELEQGKIGTSFFQQADR